MDYKILDYSVTIGNKVQPELCLAAPQSQPGRGTGYRALLKETRTSTTQTGDK